MEERPSPEASAGNSRAEDDFRSCCGDEEEWEDTEESFTAGVAKGELDEASVVKEVGAKEVGARVRKAFQPLFAKKEISIFGSHTHVVQWLVRSVQKQLHSQLLLPPEGFGVTSVAFDSTHGVSIITVVIVEVRVLCDNAKEILMKERNVQDSSDIIAIVLVYCMANNNIIRFHPTRRNINGLLRSCSYDLLYLRSVRLVLHCQILDTDVEYEVAPFFTIIVRARVTKVCAYKDGNVIIDIAVGCQ
ncbi:hypothetical protein Zm00014a_022106 [Zea mays]|uniref:Uncharacterized protein n=1 Tax=Zea mays TaxID=4577 RepID=A0A3L6FWG0_MAIZE|nr:hypothetical protein Zm00014a_022106 [Zea mays]